MKQDIEDSNPVGRWDEIHTVNLEREFGAVTISTVFPTTTVNTQKACHKKITKNEESTLDHFPPYSIPKHAVKLAESPSVIATLLLRNIYFNFVVRTDRISVLDFWSND